MAEGTVLIVGSYPAGLIVARNVLSRAGWQVATAGTLADGLRIARKLQPAALLLDEALAYAGQLREFVRRLPSNVRVVLSVPKGRSPELLSSTIAAQIWPLPQVAAVIEKPYDGDALLAALKKDRLSETPPPALEEPSQRIEIPEPDEEVILSGKLGLVPPEQVLQIAENVNAPVCCRFDSDGQRIEVFVKNRQVVDARQVELPGQEVLHLADDLDAARAAQALIYLVLRWTRGRFTMVAHAPMPAREVPINLSIAPLLLEGMHQLDLWRMRASA
jgi:CheY-like chemotaxis protein